jgi:ribonuclease HI
MSTLHIYVDSSTKGSGGTKYGESVAAWMIRYEGATLFWRCGTAYLHKSGPNKTFYEGVIRGLESALPDANNGYGDRIEVYGDCQTVINQLQGTWNVGRLEPYYKRVRALEGTFKKR